MAVYTYLTQPQIEAFLQGYDKGDLVSFEGITQGIENTNYKLETTKQPLILTVYEKRIKPEQLPAIFDLMAVCRDAGVLCPEVYADKKGNRVGLLANKPAAIQEFMPGCDIVQADITTDQAGQVGDILARMHLATQNKPGLLPASNHDVVYWRSLITQVGAQAVDCYGDGLYAQMQIALDEIEAQWPADLPLQAIHADIFPDNVLFNHGRLSTVIDFYFAHEGLAVYDYAVMINAWCADDKGDFCPDLYQAFQARYQQQRCLNAREVAVLPMMLRAAALRFFATRVYDWVHTSQQANVVKKDPAEYAQKFIKCEAWL